MRIVFTGSRYWPKQQEPMVQALAEKLVLAAKTVDDKPVVGDAAGWDTWIITACFKHAVIPEIHGAYGKLRVRVSSNAEVVLHKGDYPTRDREMVNGVVDGYPMPKEEYGSKPHFCIACWDTVSSGTRITFSEAQRVGMVVVVYELARDATEYTVKHYSGTELKEVNYAKRVQQMVLSEQAEQAKLEAFVETFSEPSA